MNINLHIERLVLDGVELERGQEPLLGAAVTAELQRIFASEGFAEGWPQGGAVPRLDAGEIQLSADGGSQHLGQQIARALYGGIRR